jgi:hypothetical protein
LPSTPGRRKSGALDPIARVGYFTDVALAFFGAAFGGSAAVRDRASAAHASDAEARLIGVLLVMRPIAGLESP